jgi:DNA-binding MarR family transcriptional regulator
VVLKQVVDEDLLPLLEVMAEFRALRKSLPAQAVAAFLYIAIHERVLLTDLEKDLKMSSASASRNSDMLSDWDRYGKPGPNLIKKEPDPLMGTRVILSMTPRGERFALTIKRILYGT